MLKSFLSDEKEKEDESGLEKGHKKVVESRYYRADAKKTSLFRRK